MLGTAAVLQAIPAVAQVGLGAYQLYKANKIAKNNIRPEYIPNQEILQNADIAASRANTGLTDASRALAMQSNERNISQSLDAILRGGGSVNNIADLYANNSDAMLKLASLDNQLQNSNIQSFLNANTAKGAERQSAWEINKFAPYADKAQLAAQLRASGMGNISGGGKGLSQVASNYLTSSMYKDQGNPSSQNGQNFDVPLSYQENMNQPRVQKYGDVYYNKSNTPEGNPGDFDLNPADRFIKSVIQSKYDPNAQQNIDLYNKGLYDPTLMMG